MNGWIDEWIGGCIMKYSSSCMSVIIHNYFIQAPVLERRRYNTLEKILHNSQKDEALLIQMTSLSSALHCPHQELNILLQDMLDHVRTGMSTKQHEIETLPNDSSRLDLISHDRWVGSACNITYSLSIHPYIYLSIYLSIYLHIYLSI